MLSFSKLAVSLVALSPSAYSAALPDKSGIIGSDIYGGTETPDSSFPKFIVSLLVKGGLACGGVLINANTVATAQHCTKGLDNDEPANWRVRAGSIDWTSGYVEVGITSWVNHEGFNMTVVDNDISLWHLAAPIHQSSNISYATLPCQGQDPPAGANVTAFGWGETELYNPKHLLQITYPVIGRAKCRTMTTDPGEIVTENMCCASTAGFKTTCVGDSGGPIVDSQTRTLWGLSSWGPGHGCATADDTFDVFVRVGQYVDWINENKF